MLSISVGGCGSDSSDTEDGLPLCVRELVQLYQSGGDCTPDAVTEYQYQDQTVYYFSDIAGTVTCTAKSGFVYTEACEVLCTIPNGVAGADCPNFFDEATVVKEVWP